MTTTTTTNQAVSTCNNFPLHVITQLTSTNINPLLVSGPDGEIWSWLFEHEVPAGNRNSSYRMMKSPYNCHMCSDRFGTMVPISDTDGSIFLPFMNISSEYIHHSQFHKMGQFAIDTCKNPISNLVLVQNSSVFGYVEKVGGWSHILRTVDPSHLTTCIDEERITLIKNCIPRYVTSGLFQRFMTRLVNQNKDSLGLMKTCLDKAAYGHTFIPAVDWCGAVLDDCATYSKPWAHFSPKEKIGFALKHVMRAGLTKDIAGSVAMLFQTANSNIIGLLEDAKSESAMIKLCAERLSPENYQRRTADASEGQISNAVKFLGDFKNTILNVQRAMELIPEMVCHGQNKTTLNSASGSSFSSVDATSSSMSGFAAQLAKVQPKTPVIPSFAARCGKTSIDVEIKDINTLKKFVDFTRAHPEIGVEISLDSGSIAYAAETTLDKDMISHRHLWAFITGHNKTAFGLSGLSSSWVQVTNTIPMYEYIIGYKCAIFVVSGIKSTADFRNCCFPEFITPEYRRVCGPAFEGLNRTMKMVIPDGQLMAGIGTSVKDDYNTLYSPVNLRINGIPVTLRTL
jgi:hypothetical protein